MVPRAEPGSTCGRAVRTFSGSVSLIREASTSGAEDELLLVELDVVHSCGFLDPVELCSTSLHSERINLSGDICGEMFVWLFLARYSRKMPIFCAFFVRDR